MHVRKRVWNTKSGRRRVGWEADAQTAEGDRVRRLFHTKRESQDFLSNIKPTKSEVSASGGGETVTLEQAVDDYLLFNHRRISTGEVSAKTTRTYERYLTNHVLAPEHGLAGQPVAWIRRRHVEDLRDALLAKGLSHATVRKVLGSLKRVFDRAMSRDWVESNCVQGVPVTTPRGRGEPHEIPSERDIELLVSKAPTSIRLPLVLTVTTGLRASELWGLKWRDLDLKRGRLQVRQRVLDNGEEGPPKSRAGRRTIPLLADVVKDLEKWHRRTRFPSDDDYVFPNRKGGPTNHLNVSRRIWRPLTEAVGVKCRWHDLRHFAVSSWLEAGVPARAVMAYAGHSTIAVTFDTYGHLLDGADHRDRFEAATSGLKLDDK